MTLDQLEADVGAEAVLSAGTPVEQWFPRSPQEVEGMVHRDKRNQAADMTWVGIAEQYDRAIDNGYATAVPAKDMFRRIRALLQ